MVEARNLLIWLIGALLAAEGVTACRDKDVTAPEGTRDIRLESPRARHPREKDLVTASRIFAGPTQYPPADFAAYGILAFRSRSSPYDRDRHLMICGAYIATIPHVSELTMLPAEQMVTVWPISSDNHSNRLNSLAGHTDNDEICRIAVDNYGLTMAQQAIKDAQKSGKTMTGTGPYLFAWSPATEKGKHDTLVLVSDLSDITTYEHAHKRLIAWSNEIEQDADLWDKGWNLDQVRNKIREWVDKYGSRALMMFGLKG